jgi:hypothetical protein
MSDDYRDLLETLLKFNARFLVVGAHALADFGAPLSALGIRQVDFQLPDMVTQLGVEPGRIDILTDVSGVDFDTAWPNHILGVVMGVEVPVIGLNDLIVNKRSTGRLRDLADLEGLQGR